MHKCTVFVVSILLNRRAWRASFFKSVNINQYQKRHIELVVSLFLSSVFLLFTVSIYSVWRPVLQWVHWLKSIVSLLLPPQSTQYWEAQVFSQNLDSLFLFLSASVNNYLFLSFSTSPLYLPVTLSTHTAGTVVGYFSWCNLIQIPKSWPPSMAFCFSFVLQFINNCEAQSKIQTR